MRFSPGGILASAGVLSHIILLDQTPRVFKFLVVQVRVGVFVERG
jgi:hypothetical protein